MMFGCSDGGSLQPVPDVSKGPVRLNRSSTASYETNCCVENVLLEIRSSVSRDLMKEMSNLIHFGTAKSVSRNFSK